MASNFSANQFDRTFNSKRLQNWETPKWFRDRPIQRCATTKIIANDRGHLLPEITRPKTSPWGHFKGTFDLPDRILSRQQALELGSPTVGTNRWNTTEVKLIERQRRNQQSERNTSEIIDEDKTKCDYSKAIEKLSDPNRVENRAAEERILNNLVELTERKEIEKMRFEVTEKPNGNNAIPIVPAVCNFQSARRMAQENLEHQPLPDSIMDRAYRRMQARGDLNPELALDVTPICTGVGVKTHKAGPTHCTKLKVYRPKTCGVVPKPLDTSTLNGRIASPCLIADKVRPMDLAICWDYRPLDPRNEPKPPPHIDGSNGNVAPAVFTVVKTPRSPDVELPTGRSGGVFSNTIGEEDFFDKDIMRRNRSYFSTRLERNTDRTCHCENSTPNRSTSATRDAKLSPLQPIKLADRCKSSPSLSMVAQASNSSANPNEKIIVCNYNQEHYHVRPVTVKCQSRDSLKSNERSSRSKASHRLCEKNLHELNRSSSRSNIQAKVEYKCAFKAGIPKSSSSGFGSSFDGSQSSTSEKAKTIKIPKPKPPYAKKNYVIDTLAPPFACWKGGAGQGGYPEHWRLSSVYRQAYKPIEQRKRPLLATVYQ